jgi:hypothetical protein
VTPCIYNSPSELIGPFTPADEVRKTSQLAVSIDRNNAAKPFQWGAEEASLLRWQYDGLSSKMHP